MRINNKGIELIKKYEGCKLHAYKCPAGVYTIGYGHTAGVTKDMTITKKQADELLLADIANYERIVSNSDKKYHWTENEFSALVSFAYNIGNISQLTQYNTRTKKQIADALPKYCKAGGKVLTGLLKRREEEKWLFLTEQPETESTLVTVAKNVIAGRYGNGAERKKAIEADGYDYKTVQAYVNKLLKEGLK